MWNVRFMPTAFALEGQFTVSVEKEHLFLSPSPRFLQLVMEEVHTVLYGN